MLRNENNGNGDINTTPSRLFKIIQILFQYKEVPKAIRQLSNYHRI